MLTVKNKSKVLVTLVMQRGVDYGHPKLAPSKQTLHRRVTLPDGTTGVKPMHLEHPASLKWLPGQTIDGLPDALEQLEQFQNFKANGTFGVTKR